MSIYRTKPSTRATNLLLMQCGSDLMKLSSENSDLHQTRVELLEKIAELESREDAFKKAVSLAANGKIPSSSIRLKVAELLNEEAPVLEHEGGSGGFVETTEKTSGINTRNNPEVERLRNFFRS